MTCLSGGGFVEILYEILYGKGAEKKRIFYGLFTEIRSQMGETNFTFGPISKFYFFVL